MRTSGWLYHFFKRKMRRGRQDGLTICAYSGVERATTVSSASARRASRAAAARLLRHFVTVRSTTQLSSSPHSQYTINTTCAPTCFEPFPSHRGAAHDMSAPVDLGPHRYRPNGAPGRFSSVRATPDIYRWLILIIVWQGGGARQYPDRGSSSFCHFHRGTG